MSLFRWVCVLLLLAAAPTAMAQERVLQVEVANQPRIVASVTAEELCCGQTVQIAPIHSHHFPFYPRREYRPVRSVLERVAPVQRVQSVLERAAPVVRTRAAVQTLLKAYRQRLEQVCDQDAHPATLVPSPDPAPMGQVSYAETLQTITVELEQLDEQLKTQAAQLGVPPEPGPTLAPPLIVPQP